MTGRTTSKPHPLAQASIVTLDQLRARLQKWYGIEADGWYRDERRRLLTTPRRDTYGMAAHETLESFWAAHQREGVAAA